MFWRKSLFLKLKHKKVVSASSCSHSCIRQDCKAVLNCLQRQEFYFHFVVSVLAGDQRNERGEAGSLLLLLVWQLSIRTELLQQQSSALRRQQETFCFVPHQRTQLPCEWGVPGEMLLLVWAFGGSSEKLGIIRTNLVNEEGFLH